MLNNSRIFKCIASLLPLTMVIGITLNSTVTVHKADTPIISMDSRFHPVIAENGMVAAQEALAANVGVEILKKGGNAVDAAVAVGYALAVTLPRAGNLGGGGFMLIHIASENKTIALDYRERAPYLATRNMFIDNNNNVDNDKARWSLQSSGVPGTVAGLNEALSRYGSMSLKDVMQPALNLARNGITVTEDLAFSLQQASPRLSRIPSTKATYYNEDGTSYRIGDIFKQPDLYQSLRLISRYGNQPFYNGSIGKKLVAYMKENNGIITEKDLADYTPKWREPVTGTYEGMTIASMPPPSSGGIHLIQLLNILEPYNLDKMGHNTSKTIHIMVEAMKQAYADRAHYLGDPDFETVPVSGLISKDYARSLRRKISPRKIRNPKRVQPGNPTFYESNETTHFSVVDQWGNAVSNTYTLNFSFGNGHVVPGTGILLNNEMDDFSAKPGVPNAYGLIGGQLNSIEPGKRMLSSMTPTIIFKDNDVFMVTGTPGGSRIITTVLQLVLNVVTHKMNIAEASNAVRIHHQWYPDEIRVERGLNSDIIRDLERRGHTVVTKRAMGSSQSIVRRDGRLYGASDPRKPGAAAIGY